MSKFLTPLEYREINDKLFVLTTPLVYESDLLGMTVTVPEGFPTDGPSVPRVPIIYLIWGNRALAGATLHDWLYAWQGVPRELADKTLREACEVCNLPGWIKEPYYIGVRLGGWKAWNEDKITQIKWRAKA